MHFHKKEINLEVNIEPKFLRLKHILGDRKSNPPIKPIIPVSKSAWWDGIKKGHYPKGIKIGPNTTAWRSDHIQDLVNTLCSQKQIFIYSFNFKNKFLKNIFVKWCKSVISVKVIDFIEEYRLHFYYVITLISQQRNSKKF